jgi:hypothetical protein
VGRLIVARGTDSFPTISLKPNKNALAALKARWKRPAFALLPREGRVWGCFGPPNGRNLNSPEIIRVVIEGELECSLGRLNVARVSGLSITRTLPHQINAVAAIKARRKRPPAAPWRAKSASGRPGVRLRKRPAAQASI